MGNVLMVIAPYWEHGTWVFDDEARSLVKEPFVSGIPEMIDVLVQAILDARRGFRLTFSAGPFPGYQKELTWVKEDFNGNWYRTEDPPMEGWLCPALLLYFDEPPEKIYVKAEPKNNEAQT